MKKEKKASVLVYSIILTSVSLILAIIVLSNYKSLITNVESIETEKGFYSNIESNVDTFSKKIQEVNSDWNWFSDITSWSWSNIWCKLQWDWSYLVEWDEWTKIWTDWRDDNCDDDNYLWINFWNSSFEDNDNYVRKTINWLVLTWTTKNIFWNNSKINDYIDSNPNNTDSFNKKMWNLREWFLNLEINWNLELKIIKVDRDRYNEYNEFEKTLVLTWTINSWSGYIEDDWGVLKLTPTTSWAFKFDFKNEDYILMIKNLENNQPIDYTLKGIDKHWNWIYINPIDDSNSNSASFKLLGYDIILNENWSIQSKIVEMVWQK